MFVSVFDLHSLEVLGKEDVLPAHLGIGGDDRDADFGQEVEFFQVLGVLQSEELQEVVQVLGLRVIAGLGTIGLEHALDSGDSEQRQQESLFILIGLQLDVGDERDEIRSFADIIKVHSLDMLVQLLIIDANTKETSRYLEHRVDKLVGILGREDSFDGLVVDVRLVDLELGEQGE